MAYSYNYKFWVAASEDMHDMFLHATALKKVKPTQDKRFAHDIFARIYGRYVGLVNNLGDIYDQTLQVQKRALVERLLIAASNRLLVLKEELKKIELSEFVYLDNTLIEQKICFETVTLLRPYYFPHKRVQEVQDLVDGKIPRPIPSEISTETSSVASGEYIEGIEGEPQKKVDEEHKDETKEERKARKKALKKQKLEEEKTHGKPKFPFIVEEVVDPEVAKMRRAVDLIKIHEKARRSRVFFANIRAMPDKYKPRIKTKSTIFYEFTHEPEQQMLVQVKRTSYDTNFIAKKKVLEEFDYYLSPASADWKTPKNVASLIYNVKASIHQFSQLAEIKDLSIPEKTQSEPLHRLTDELDTVVEVARNQRKTKSEPILGTTYERDEEKKKHEGKDKKTDQPEGGNANEIKNGGEKTMIMSEPIKTRRLFIESEEKKKIEIEEKTVGRCKVGIVYERQLQDLSESQISLVNKLDKISKNRAAYTIQRAWRNYKRKKKEKREEMKRKIFLGMNTEMYYDKKLNKALDDLREVRRNKKEQYDQEFIKVMEDEKARILKVKGPWIMEDISDHIRAWFKEFYYSVRNFHTYPEEWEGGTILVLRGETMTVEEFREQQDAKEKKKGQSAADKKKEAEKRKKEKEKEKAKKLKEKKDLEKKKKSQGSSYDFGYTETPRYFADIKKVMKEYDNDWINIDEENNVTEKPYMEWIRLDKYCEVHQELRIVVDELMRVEFELLRKSLAKDMKKKYKPQKKKKQKKQKKGKGKKKKKEPKDITADRTIESLFYELLDKGIITEYGKNMKLENYLGDYNYSAYERRNLYNQDPKPGKGEIMHIIREWLLGMGPLELPKPKSILIAGPPFSGKYYLVKAMAAETNAVLLNISPENVLQYEEDMKYFVHLINKMARLLQPTIIFISEVDRIFWKKVPKDQKDLKPKLLGKFLIKQIVKPIKNEEKVMVVGTSSEPWRGQLAKLKKSFEKILLVPNSDYSTSFIFHHRVILSKHGVARDFECSPLAMVTKGYGSSQIYNNIEASLNIERRMKLPLRPLKHEELIEGYLTSEPPVFPMTDKEYEKYTKWYTKASKLAKARANYMKELEKAEAKNKKK